ncbi:uncharacterized protein LOC134845211, partial [Symsagittifera roscoffensis]|uniref:uncharacterized protein LOC134845211 n=1 Tax=Symsagittifera roscoffensis TaxID=84072 RepID=UPI00307C4CD0
MLKFILIFVTLNLNVIDGVRWSSLKFYLPDEGHPTGKLCNDHRRSYCLWGYEIESNVGGQGHEMIHHRRPHMFDHSHFMHLISDSADGREQLWSRINWLSLDPEHWGVCCKFQLDMY